MQLQTGRWRLITCAESEAWDAIISTCPSHDFYYGAAYHRLHEERGEGRGVLIVYEESGQIAALPLLVRDVNSLQGLDAFDCVDATSVYGYAGPLTNTGWQDERFKQCFNDALCEALETLNVVSAFSRLNPLLGNERGLHIGQVVETGVTVSLDLTESPDAVFRRYRSRYRTDIRKARSRGLAAVHDSTWRRLDTFIDLYRQTMERLGAPAWYRFDRDYFEQLRAALGDALHLFVLEQGGQTLTGGLFTLVNGTVQYHLGGSHPAFPEPAAGKILFDDVRLWAQAHGAHVFHLGGGVGARRDSLYQFKSGFSHHEHPFSVWRYIAQPHVYNALDGARHTWGVAQGYVAASESYFPAYRTPLHLPS